MLYVLAEHNYHVNRKATSNYAMQFILSEYKLGKIYITKAIRVIQLVKIVFLIVRKPFLRLDGEFRRSLELTENSVISNLQTSEHTVNFKEF